MRDPCATLAAASLLMLSGCASGPASSPHAAAEPIERAVQALITGARAHESDDADALRAAAGVLSALGAAPAEGQADLAALWSARAADLGADPVAPRGRTAGPAYREGLLAAGERTGFTDTFHSGRPAVVSVAPRGEATFVLGVRGGGGEELCREVAESGPAECRWTPVWTTPVRIEVANLSGGPARYFLLTN